MAGSGATLPNDMTRADLHRLVDELPEESIAPATTLLERARDPFWATLEAAPMDDEPLTADDIATVEGNRGQPGLSLEELEAELG